MIFFSFSYLFASPFKSISLVLLSSSCQKFPPPGLGTSLQPIEIMSPSGDKIAAPICRDKSTDRSETDLARYIPNSFRVGEISFLPNSASKNLEISLSTVFFSLYSIKKSIAEFQILPEAKKMRQIIDINSIRDDETKWKEYYEKIEKSDGVTYFRRVKRGKVKNNNNELWRIFKFKYFKPHLDWFREKSEYFKETRGYITYEFQTNFIDFLNKFHILEYPNIC